MRTPKVQKQPTSKPTWKTALIDPKVAAHILEQNGVDIQRLRGSAAFKTYSKDMRAGRWALNGDAIIYNAHGKLIDGRLRLAACVEADSSFPTFVVENVSLDAEVTIDSHRKRRVSDVLYIAGRDDAVSVSATANSIMQISQPVRMRNDPVSTQAVKAFVDANPDLATSIAYVEMMRVKTPSPALTSALHFLAWKIDREKCEAFFAGLNAADPTDTKDHAPYAALARAVKGLKDGQLHASNQRESLHVFLIKAWNAFYDGATVPKLRWGAGEEIPVLKGLGKGVIDMGQAPVPPVRTVQKNYQQALHGTGISIEIRTITPADAEAMLENNGPSVEEQKRNRKQSSSAIELYARDMKRGNWRLNGQAIKISASGSLLDGQHRAAACVKSGVPFETMVITGLPEAVFATFDLHAKKNFSKTVGRMGYANGGVVAGALRIVWQYENYGLETSAYPTHIELNEALDRHGKYFPDSIHYANRKSIKPFSASSTMAALHYILTDLSERSKEFFEKFESGADLSVGNPILTLRKRLQEDKESRRSSSSERDRLMFVTRSWKSFIEGKTMHFLKKGGSFDPHFTKPHPIEVDKSMAA
jgi:hypothetical protein